jgi:hypothetical protein
VRRRRSSHLPRAAVVVEPEPAALVLGDLRHARRPNEAEIWSARRVASRGGAGLTGGLNPGRGPRGAVRARSPGGQAGVHTLASAVGVLWAHTSPIRRSLPNPTGALWTAASAARSQPVNGSSSWPSGTVGSGGARGASPCSMSRCSTASPVATSAQRSGALRLRHARATCCRRLRPASGWDNRVSNAGPCSSRCSWCRFSIPSAKSCACAGGSSRSRPRHWVTARLRQRRRTGADPTSCHRSSRRGSPRGYTGRFRRTRRRSDPGARCPPTRCRRRRAPPTAVP